MPKEVKGNFYVTIFFPSDEGRNIGIFFSLTNPFVFDEGNIIIKLDG